VSTASLGLETLPQGIVRLAAGMVYAIACAQQAVRLPLAAAALRASLVEGKRCALVTPLDARMFLRKARLAGHDLEGHVRSGVLTVFTLCADAAKQMFRLGPEGFLRELQANLPGPGAFLVLDSADPLFMLSDPRAGAEAAQCYVDWVARLDHTALALFAPAAEAPRDYLALRLVAENFGGYAVASSAGGGALLDVRHWFGAEGAMPRESFALRTQGNGMLQVAPAPGDEHLPPVDSVIYVRGVIESEAVRSWQEAESVADAVDAARRSEAATLLLPFEHPRQYELLCRAVVTVRAMARRSLRVVIRERHVRLRASQALALLRLGISTVVPADAPDGVAKRMVESLRGSHFTRSYEMDAQHVDEESVALLQAAPSSKGAFCEAIERLLAEDPSLAGRIELHLAGDLTDADRAASAGHGFVRDHGSLPHARTVALMRSADLLFLPMHDLPPGRRTTIVPGKTYEYLATGRPILAAVPDGDARDLLRDAGAHVVAPTDDAAMADVIRSELDEPSSPAPAQLDRYEYAAVTRSLAEILDGVIGVRALR